MIRFHITKPAQEFFLLDTGPERRVSQKSTIELKQGGDGGCWAIPSHQAGLSSAGRSYVTSGCVWCAGLRFFDVHSDLWHLCGTLRAKCALTLFTLLGQGFVKLAESADERC